MLPSSLLALYLCRKTSMVISTPVHISQKPSLQQNRTMTSMIENFLQSFLPSLNGSTTSKGPPIQSPSSPITKTSHTSRTLANSLVVKLAGPSFSRTSTSNGLSPQVLRWALQTLFLTKMILIHLLTITHPPLSLTLLSSMLLTSPSPNPSHNPPPLIHWSFESYPPYKMDPHCFLASTFLIGILTTAISISKIVCMFLLPLTPPSSIPCIPPPPLATWVFSTQRPSLNTISGGQA